MTKTTMEKLTPEKLRNIYFQLDELENDVTDVMYKIDEQGAEFYLTERVRQYQESIIKELGVRSLNVWKKKK